jgi:hypothetical protein
MAIALFPLLSVQFEGFRLSEFCASLRLKFKSPKALPSAGFFGLTPPCPSDEAGRGMKKLRRQTFLEFERRESRQ